MDAETAAVNNAQNGDDAGNANGNDTEVTVVLKAKEVKTETATENPNEANENVNADGDTNTDADAAVTITIKKPATTTTTPTAEATPTPTVEQATPEDDIEEEVVEEIIEGDEDGEVVEIVETTQVVDIADAEQKAEYQNETAAEANADAATRDESAEETASESDQSAVEANEQQQQQQEPEQEQQVADDDKNDQIQQTAVAETKTEEVETAKQATPIQQSKQQNLNNTIKEIISDIDNNIEEEENIAKLKQQEFELLKKQQELAQQIRQQQLLAQQLAAENELKLQQLQRQQLEQQQQQQQLQQLQQQQQQQQLQLQQQQSQQQQQQQTWYPKAQTREQEPEWYQKSQPQPPQQQPAQPLENVSRYSTSEVINDGNNYTRKTETFESRESSSNVSSKKIDLHKIFTPATDAEEILPRNRKLYASSAFYSPALHPTVEDQVELARRISHSLSDISNHKSKGQSMYVNRKKRSVKWVHEGSGKEITDASALEEFTDEYKENSEQNHEESTNTTTATTAAIRSSLEKLPMKLLMNPRGQILDFNSLRESINTETGLLSPDRCAEVMNALQTQQGKGAELFAKRRRKADKWVVDETNAGIQSPSGLPDYHQYQPKPSVSPSCLPAYSDAGKHRVQLNLQQEQLIEKYAKPGLKVVKTPWEAALETGSASAAFVEQNKTTSYQQQQQQQQQLQQQPQTQSYQPTYEDYNLGRTEPDSYQATYASKQTSNNQRDLAYKPSIPQGWRAPSVSLPRDLYVPKEIPLESYAPPPAVAIKDTTANRAFTKNYWQPPTSSSSFGQADTLQYSSNDYGTTKPSSFPVSNAYTGFPYATDAQPPKQQYWAPTSYQKVSPTTGQVPQVNFNPSPLPYEKLSKFENTSEHQQQTSNFYGSRPVRSLAPQSGSKVRNISPTPFGRAANIYSPQPTQSHGSYAGSSQNSAIHTPIPTTPTPTSRYSSADYLHSPNYNSAARGWTAAANAAPKRNLAYHHQTPMAAAGGNLPYTDF